MKSTIFFRSKKHLLQAQESINCLFFAGIFFVLPCIESYQKVDLRTITLGVPPQEVHYIDSYHFEIYIDKLSTIHFLLHDNSKINLCNKEDLMIKLVIINDSNIAKLLLSVITNNRFFTHLGPTWGRK